MKGQPVGFFKFIIDKEMYMFFFIVYQSKRGYRTWFHTKKFLKAFVGGKGKFSLPEPFFKIFYIKLLQVFQNDQIVSVTFMIAEENILTSS